VYSTDAVGVVFVNRIWREDQDVGALLAIYFQPLNAYVAASRVYLPKAGGWLPVFLDAGAPWAPEYNGNAIVINGKIFPFPRGGTA
jgi:hypothetical protein